MHDRAGQAHKVVVERAYAAGAWIVFGAFVQSLDDKRLGLGQSNYNL